jgi:hypothetical protein
MIIEQIVLRILVTLITIFGLIRYANLSSLFKLVVWYLLISGITEFCVLYRIYNHSSYDFLFHILVIIEVPLFWLMFRETSGNILMRKIQVLTFGLLFVLVLSTSIFIHKFNTFPSYSILLLCLVVTIMSFFKFKEMLDEPQTSSILKQSQFWLFTSLFVFHTGSAFLWLAHEYLYGDYNAAVLIQTVIMGLNFLLYGLIGYGLILERKHNNVNIRD